MCLGLPQTDDRFFRNVSAQQLAEAAAAATEYANRVQPEGAAQHAVASSQLQYKEAEAAESEQVAAALAAEAAGFIAALGCLEEALH